MESITKRNVERLRKAKSDAFKVEVYDTVVAFIKCFIVLLLAMIFGGVSDPRL